MKRTSTHDLARTSSSRIWRSVVVAGAMLGGACGGSASSTPAKTPTAADANPTPIEPAMSPTDEHVDAVKPAEAAGTGDATMPATGDPAANPCAGTAADPLADHNEATPTEDKTPPKKPVGTGRIRGGTGGGKRPTGRGFVLA